MLFPSELMNKPKIPFHAKAPRADRFNRGAAFSLEEQALPSRSVSLEAKNEVRDPITCYDKPLVFPSIESRFLFGPSIGTMSWRIAWNTEDNIATPCSVKTPGKAEECFSLFNRSQFVTRCFFTAL